MRRNIARALGLSSNHITLIDEAMSKIAEVSTIISLIFTISNMIIHAEIWPLGTRYS